MVEYGNGVGEMSRQAGSGGRVGGGPDDLGATFAGFVSDSADRLAALPPEMLALLIVGVLAGLFVLRRAV